MLFEILSIALTLRCLVVTNRLRDSYFHAQAWKAWMTFFVVLLALHVVEIAGLEVFGVPGAESSQVGDVVEVVAMVALWVAVELSMSTLARRWLEAHEEVRAIERACQRRIRQMRESTGTSLQPNGAEAHSQGDPFLDSAVSRQGNRA